MKCVRRRGEAQERSENTVTDHALIPPLSCPFMHTHLHHCELGGEDGAVRVAVDEDDVVEVVAVFGDREEGLGDGREEGRRAGGRREGGTSEKGSEKGRGVEVTPHIMGDPP